MPRTQINSDNKPQDASGFPKLKLTKDSRARILLMSMEPEMNWVHNLQAPMVEGEKILTKEDGSYKFKFHGNPICFGDLDILHEKGIDADNCPVCAVSKLHGDMFDPPKRRYALPIIQYDTDSKGAMLEPYSCKVIAWAFPDSRFTKLCEFQEEFGDLRMYDLKLGPCENELYQKYDIAIAGGANWLTNDESKARTAEVWKSQQPTDEVLVGLCGKSARMDWVRGDITKVEDAWAEVHKLEGRGKVAAPASAEIDSLLDTMETQQAISAQAPEPSPAAPVPVAASSGAVDMDASVTPEPAAVPVDATPAPVADIGSEGVGQGEEIDLDAILNGTA